MNPHSSLDGKQSSPLGLDNELFEAARRLFAAQCNNLRTLAAELAGSSVSAVDAQMLASQAHNIAGTARYFGDRKLGELAVRIEQDLLGATNDHDRAAACRSLLTALAGGDEE